MLAIGKRDTIVTIERATPAEDDYGTQAPPLWDVYAREYAAVLFGTGAERREAAQQASSMPATVTVLANNRTRGIKTTDRLLMHGAVWNIVGAAPMPGRALIALTVVRGQD